jgi:hypothetical protein
MCLKSASNFCLHCCFCRPIDTSLWDLQILGKFLPFFFFVFGFEDAIWTGKASEVDGRAVGGAGAAVGVDLLFFAMSNRAF